MSMYEIESFSVPAASSIFSYLYSTYFQIRLHRFEAVFIDTFYSSDDPHEKSKYDENVEVLWTFSTQAKPFECKDIIAALNDLMEAKQSITILKDELRKKDQEIKG